MPCLGETTEVRNLWSAAAVWVKEGPGMAQVVAEWMTYGYPRVIDAHGADIARFYEPERNDEHIWGVATEHFNKTYGIVHPAEQWESRRNLQVSPLFSRQGGAGRLLLPGPHMGAPAVVRQRTPTSSSGTASPSARSSGTTAGGARSRSANISTCARTCGLVDLSAFQIFQITGPGAVEFADYLCVNKIGPVGRATYTPWLTPDGGFHSDLTMQRVAEDTVNVVTGVFDGGRDLAWIKKYMPKDGSVTVTDRTLDYSTLGLWGPNAPAVLAKLTDADLSHEGSPYGSIVKVQLDCAGETIDAALFRISYVGDSGWEIYVDWDDAPKLWDALMEAGADLGIRATGGGVYGTSGRIEKGYRLQGAELESEYNPLEAGLARPKVKSADFIGKEAYLAGREAGDPEVLMCTMTVDDQTDSQGRVRWMQGGNEPMCDLDGNTIFDSHGRVSRVTTAGYGPSVGKLILMGYLPREMAAAGTKLQVMYMNEFFPVTVVGTDGPFDPDDTRLKG